MTKDEAVAFFDLEVKGRFNKWNPPDVLVRDWIDWLQNLSYSDAEEGIKEHYFESDRTYPVLKRFYAHAKKQQNKDSPYRRHQLPNDWTKYKIVCIAGKRKGFEKTAALRKELIDNDIAEKIEAEKLMTFFKERYGGEWEVVKLDERPGEEHSEGLGVEDDIPF